MIRHRLTSLVRPVINATCTTSHVRCASSASRMAQKIARSTASLTQEVAAQSTRKTWMQQQVELEKSQSPAPRTVEATSIPALPSIDRAINFPTTHRSRTLLVAPRSTRTPRALQSAMQRLTQSGLTRTVNGRTIVLPGGMRVLERLERIMEWEMKQFQCQTVKLSHTRAAGKKSVQAHAAFLTHTPYPSSLTSNISDITSLVASDFRSGNLQSASLRCIHHTPTSSKGELWPDEKSLEDIALFDTKHAVGLERYHALVEAYRIAFTHAKENVHVVETQSDSNGIAQVDADLAHEVHVEVKEGDRGSSSLLRCTHCDYAAHPARAISREGISTSVRSSESTDLFPAVSKLTRSWALGLIDQLLPAHVIDSLGLQKVEKKWKVELIYHIRPIASSNEDEEPSQEHVLFAVVMRQDHEVNLPLVSEHISVPLSQIQRVDHVSQVVAILQQQGVDVSSVASSLPNAPSSAISILPSFSSRPELLIDQALIPPELDLDVELIEEEEQEQADGAEEEEGDESLPPAEEDPSTTTPDPATLSRMERTILQAQSKLRPGEQLDFVQLEMQAKGLDVKVARAKLVQEAVQAQKQQYEHNEGLKEADAKLDQLKLQVDQDDSATEYDPEVEKEIAHLNPDSHTLSTPPTPSVFQALIPHFSYSMQGFFRLASEKEPCAFCEEGHLKRVGTNVVANTVFIGKQQLVDEDGGEEDDHDVPASKSSRKSLLSASKKPKKKRFLHTSYGRFSPYDTLAHLASKHLVSSSSLSSTTPANALTTPSTLFLPPLLTPWQIALIPVTRPETSTRDLYRASTVTEDEVQRVHDATSKLHTDLLSASLEPSGLPLDFEPPSLAGEILLDDSYDSPTGIRVQHALSLGVPIVLLLSPATVEKGFVTLLLNKPNLKIEPRRIALAGLPQLIRKMVLSNYAPIVHTKQNIERQRLERQGHEEHMLMHERT